MSESANLRVGESRQQRDDIIHQVLIVNNGVLTLFHQGLNEVAEVATEFLPLGTRHDHGIFPAFLFNENRLSLLSNVKEKNVEQG